MSAELRFCNNAAWIRPSVHYFLVLADAQLRQYDKSPIYHLNSEKLADAESSFVASAMSCIGITHADGKNAHTPLNLLLADKTWWKLLDVRFPGALPARDDDNADSNKDTVTSRKLVFPASNKMDKIAEAQIKTLRPTLYQRELRSTPIPSIQMEVASTATTTNKAARNGALKNLPIGNTTSTLARSPTKTGKKKMAREVNLKLPEIKKDALKAVKSSVHIASSSFHQKDGTISLQAPVVSNSPNRRMRLVEPRQWEQFANAVNQTDDHRALLGLARVAARNAADQSSNERKSSDWRALSELLYKAVLKTEGGMMLHDAVIEYGELLMTVQTGDSGQMSNMQRRTSTQSDETRHSRVFLAAATDKSSVGVGSTPGNGQASEAAARVIELYAEFLRRREVLETANFSDGYLYAELCRLLMRREEFSHPALGMALSGLAKTFVNFW